MRRTPLTSFLALLVLMTQALAVSAADSVGDTAPEAAAAAFVHALNQRNESAAADFLDMHALGERIGKAMTSNPTEQLGIAQALNESNARKLIQSYLKILDSRHGTVRLMKTSQRDGQMLALVRFDLNGSGFDYLEFILQPDSAGHFRAVDWYQLSRGELMSVNLGALVKLMADPDPDLVHRLLGTTSFDPKQVARLKEIGTLQRAGDYAGALAVANQLPPEIADSRIVLTLRVTLASLAKDVPEYHRLLEVLAHKYSDDPARARHGGCLLLPRHEPCRPQAVSAGHRGLQVHGDTLQGEVRPQAFRAAAPAGRPGAVARVPEVAAGGGARLVACLAGERDFRLPSGHEKNDFEVAGSLPGRHGDCRGGSCGCSAECLWSRCT
jgi:hypothetical protein